MHRIDTEGAAGVWTNGNPALGQLGTEVDAAFMQDLQENLCHAIEQANIALAKGDATQLYAAILAIAAGAAGTGGGETPTTRKVQAGGLVTGGGDLTADRTLTVVGASPAEIVAGARDDAAVTPAGLAGAIGKPSGASGTAVLPGGTIFKWGGLTAAANEGQFQVLFDQPFPTACDRVTLTAINGTANNQRDIWAQLVSKSPQGFVGFYNFVTTGGLNSIDGVDWFAIGR